ncbi:multidrug efflux system outer membrane protein [Parabacteroides sp. PF5-5]|uniref:TolC family protein n=1 Tax=unclassified Parabacteroides TaxID=2649774 RepID=UPI002476557F|nr:MULTISPECIES: TolC family protein [unclassified Parabacteroides]MDH6303615.1 multidrug efflux system outer membrane protein [Parabacteroides sp. PH5-39]MDH6314937.1 multidrug efflux system outer membrane protein [Parabacteroides sp. PF5-13]MDH6318274.1 multidrug efflux system outer membrane protein [Parabacteroides sp. PH5-13]MDH6321793.1 multidrug efflux system outer membrane protein [Parabacteroides sp. PH5-8]MDH6325917.1 multidrug efflux system outer membrane protein [Parabacteroides sp.
MNKMIILISLATLLSSCGIYNSYRRPDVQTDGLFGVAEQVSDTGNIANIHWRGFFTDPLLQDLIEKGLNNNTDLKVARLQVEQAEASLQSARLAFFPSLFLSPQGVLSSFDGGKTNKTYQVPVAASWELDVFGKLHNAKRRAKAAYEQSEVYQQAVQTQLISTIANLYYTLLMLDSQLEISEATAAKWKENVRTTKAMKEAGMMTEASVAQTEANSHSIDASLLTLRRQINEVENSLSILLGEMPQDIRRGSLDTQKLPEELTVGVPLELLSNRPDVKSAELTLVQMFYSTNEARAAFYPSITLSGTAGWTNEAGSMIINPGKFLWTAIGSLTQPLFNKGINISRLKTAKAQQEAAQLNFQQSLLNAGSEVNNALVQWQTARQRIEIDQKQIASLETAVKSTQLLMKHGSSTYLEVLTAQETLLQAQLTVIADQFDEIQGAINLYHALGGGNEE